MQSYHITVFVNGQPKDIAPDQSVAALLESLRVSSDKVAVELNQSIVRKRDWQRTPVPDGSQIEIVEFVGGG